MQRLLARIACWIPVPRYVRMNKDDGADVDDVLDSMLGDSLLWCRDLEKHACGEFSFAVVQANEVLEDQSQVETGRDATFIGVYDGHGGPEASRFICDHLFLHLTKHVREHGTISEDILRSAFSATEEGFLALVRQTFGIKPLMAATGSCCLVGIVWRGTLYVANLGDSRAVIGSSCNSNKIVAEQLTQDHNASIEEIREEVRSLHPDDEHIVFMKNGVWRIKGIIQVSRSIGDAYLKRSEFSMDPSFPRFHLPEPIRRPVLTAEPSVYSRALRSQDKFAIFASDGLWEHLTNQQAVEIVHNNPRAGIARRLLKVALNEAARKKEMSYADIQKLEKGTRRNYHDDITVVVIYLDHELLEDKLQAPELSIRGFMDTVGPSNFSILHGIANNA
ncbi:hypothetical protein SAY86_025613 [Trapa natans]|uniref:protein-serine/threonine phosphatase n=1 Tax=Trapa natans TaxID=22666 RepID=A0AAN7M0Z2_TRANT|nr:hypothetical protein SAY86_025613 [Trapa natans]